MKTTEPLQKHLINLYRGDYERLSELFTERSASEVIRMLVRKYIEDVERLKQIAERS